MDHLAAPAARLRGLYAIADASAPVPLLELVGAFARAGACAVQLRAKELPAGELLELARRAVALCRPLGVLLIVNDRADLAALAQADGVHLGQEDLPVPQARALLGPGALIGVSTHSDDEIAQALREGADCLGFGPVLATATKARTAQGAAPLPPPHGFAGLARAVERAAGTPVIAIGGLDARTAPDAARAGAACVAAIGALCSAPEPEVAARAMVRAFREAA